MSMPLRGCSRVKLTLAYVGTAFSGWQIQAPARPEGKVPRTVQGELETALFRLLGIRIRVHGAGRTDAGVHADMQTAHFDVPSYLPRINWTAALGGLLPDDVGVLGAEEAPPDFHARFSAVGKVYTYVFSLSVHPPPPRVRPFVWSAGPLDLEMMDKAARVFVGEHDFAAFQNAGGSAGGQTRRRLDEALRLPWNPGPGLPDGGEGLYWAWRFTGNGFLKQMVRNIVGFLAEAGRGRMNAADAAGLLASGGPRRGLRFATVPARGLTLSRVLY